MEAQDNNAVGLTIDKEENRNILEGFYLSRLRGFLSLSEAPGMTHWEQHLVKRAIYSTYLDCVSVGLADEARAILEGRESGPTRALVVRN